MAARIQKVAILLCGCFLSIHAQEKLEFEIASVKPRLPNVPAMVGVDISAGGRVTVSAANLKSLMETAFGVAYWQISGGEPWMEKDEFNVEALPPENLRSSVSRKHSWTAIEDQRLRQMLQALLIDRFQLKFHRETKTGDVYLLQRNTAKPLALKPTDSAKAALLENTSGHIGYSEGWGLNAATMPQLVEFASNYYLHAPVIDQTGLTGPYDFRQSEPPSPEPENVDQNDRFLRLIPALGLKLERTKGPVEVLVIESAAKPSAN